MTRDEHGAAFLERAKRLREAGGGLLELWHRELEAIVIARQPSADRGRVAQLSTIAIFDLSTPEDWHQAELRATGRHRTQLRLIG